MSAIRVALVDDQSLFRAGIRMLVSSQPDLEFVGEAGDGAESVAMVAASDPDVVLMDIRMPVMDGIAATRAILEDAAARGTTPPRVVALTTFDLDEAAARAIRAGASGFLLKDTEPEFLLAVDQGGAFRDVGDRGIRDARVVRAVRTAADPDARGVRDAHRA